MPIGPAPMIMMDLMSVRLGIGAYGLVEDGLNCLDAPEWAAKQELNDSVSVAAERLVEFGIRPDGVTTRSKAPAAPTGPTAASTMRSQSDTRAVPPRHNMANRSKTPKINGI